MENASKALIIAGAILLSILIIALGIFIFNQAKGAINTNSLDATQKSTFNDPLENYLGEGKMGSNLTSLIGDLITNASTNKGAAEYLPTVVLYNDSTGTTKVDLTGDITEDGLPTSSSDKTYVAVGDTTAADDQATYISGLTAIRNKLTKKHNYTVDMGYNTAGLVSEIVIYYSVNE